MKLKTLSEDELIQQALNGSQAHLDALIAIYEPFILDNLRRGVKDKADLMDLRQKVCCKIADLLSKKKYNHKNKFPNWTNIIIRNELSNYFRLKKRQQNCLKEYALEFCSVYENECEFNEESIGLSYNVMEFLNEIPFDQALVIRLKCIENKTFKEISNITKTSINTVMGRYRYGIERIRTLIKNQSEK